MLAILPLHDILRQKYPWYYRWHLNSSTSTIHGLILSIYMIVLAFIISFSLLGGPYEPVKAASYASTGSGPWSDPATWGGGGTPGTGDDATISAGHTVTLTASATVGSVIVSDTGILALGSLGYILTLDGAVATPLTVTGTGVLNPGTSSTVKYTNVYVSGNVSVATTTYNNLQFTPASAETYQLTGHLTSGYALTGTLTVSTNAIVTTTGSNYGIEVVNVTINNGTFTMNGSTITVSGNWDSATNGTFTAGTSKVYLTGTGDLRTKNWVTFYDLYFPTSGTTTTTQYNFTGISHTLTFGSSTNDVVTGSSVYLYVTGTGTPVVDSSDGDHSALQFSYIPNSGAVNVTGGTYALVYFYSWGDATLTMTGSLTAGRYEVVSSAATKTVTLDLNGWDITATDVYGFITVGSSTDSTKNGVLRNTSLTTKSTATIKSLTIYNGGGNNKVLANGTQTIDFNIYTVGLSTSWTNNDTYTYSDASTVTFSAAAGTQTLNSGGTGAGKTFNNLWHGGAGTLQLTTNAVKVDGTLTNAAGTFDANDIDISVAKNWTISGGSFSADVTPGATTQTVTFIGNATADETITTSGQAFKNVTLNNTQAVNDDVIILGNLDVNGLLTISDGDLDVSANDPNVNLGGGINFTHASDGSVDLSAYAGTWTFDGTGTWTDAGTTKRDIGTITINGTAATLTLGSSVKASVITIEADDILNLALSGYTLELEGTGAVQTVLTVTGTLTPGDSTVKYTATHSTLNVNVATTTYDNLQFSGAETYDMTGNLTGANALTGNLTIDANAILDNNPGTDYSFSVVNVTINTSGKLDATSSSATFTASGNWSHPSSGFTRGTSTVDLTGAGAITIPDWSGFYNLKVAQSGNTTTANNQISISNTLTIGTGTFNVGWGGITLSGNGTPLVFTDPIAGAITGQSNAHLSFRGTTTQELPGHTYGVAELVLRSNGNPSLTVTMTGDVVVNGNLKFGQTGFTNNDARLDTSSVGNYSLDINGNVSVEDSGSVITLNGSQVNISGNVNLTGVTFNANTSTVIFDKLSSTQTLTSGGAAFNNLTHSEAGTLQLADAINIDGNFTNSAGAFDANNQNINLAGNFTVSGGSFSADVAPGATTQTVILDGAGGTMQTISGSTTFYNLTATASAARQLTFTAGTTQTVSGTWTITGAAGQLITLTTSSAPTQWTVNPTTASVSYVDVNYSNNTGIDFCAANSTSTNNNNTAWSISTGATCNDTITLSVDNPTIAFGSLLPGTVVTGTTITTVTTNYGNGYTLATHDNVAGSDSVLLHTDTTTRIIDYAGTIAIPTLWSGTGLGISVYQATGKETKWGTGTTEGDSNNKYAGIPQNATEIHAKTGSPTTGDTTYVGYKLVVPNSQKTGDYSGTITYTATGVLN